MDHGSTAGDDYERVREWEDGLPSASELTPLSQCLISPQLASAFRITSDIPPFHTSDDVHRASHSIVAILRGISPAEAGANPDESHPSHHRIPGENHHVHAAIQPQVKSDGVNAPTPSPPDRGHVVPHPSDAETDADVEPEEVDSAPAPSENPNEESSSRTPKRPRLVWTPELHKRFIEAVGHLGINNAVPKTIMQLMNVEGLTRENVASHLQKYRIYLKRMQGLSTEGPSSSDHIFASTPVPPAVAMQSGFYVGARPPPEESMPSSFNAPPYAPMPMPRGHVVGTSNSAGPLQPPAQIDPYAYHVFVPPTMQRFVQADPKQMHGSGQHQESPSHHILRLFPAGK